MLNFDLFQAAIGELKALNLAGGPDGKEGMLALYKHVNTIPDDTFLRLVDDAAKNLEFFPKPKWFREGAADLRRPELQKAKLLPFAEPTDTPAVCPPHVRKWMQVRAEAIAEEKANLVSARRSALSRLFAEHMMLTGKRLENATPAMLDAVERDPKVVEAKKGFGGGNYKAEMAAIAQSMTPEEEAEFTYEFTIEDETVAQSVPPKGEEEDW